MSYHGDGRVSSDFVGNAREWRDAEEADALHLDFTGAACDVTADESNDGSHECGAVLDGRTHAAMKAADRDADRHRRWLKTITGSTAPARFAPRWSVPSRERDLVPATAPASAIAARSKDE